VPESFEAVRNLGGGSVSICFLPYAGIKGLVQSGFGYSILPQHALLGRNRFFQTYRIAGHRLTRSLALAMVRTDYPRKLTQAVAAFLQKLLPPRPWMSGAARELQAARWVHFSKLPRNRRFTSRWII
jgi:hypothetical protein